jgi:hypothetical protein
MTITEHPPSLHPALDYHAPFVIEKLVRDQVVDSDDEGEELFREALRYLVLADSDSSTSWKMYSTRVDEAWHQFVLFTVKYTEFCHEFFGGYRHHAPSNAPAPSPSPAPEPRLDVEDSTLDGFARRYEEVFGEPLPEVWYDHRTITPRRRLINAHIGVLTLDEGTETIALVDPTGQVVFEVNDIAGEALQFIASHGSFFVRELPGDLTDEEKVALASGLVECSVLRVAA